ncbi:carboxylate-amine ligase [Nocardioides mangrovi]|uniref:Putative glutamate--cysteine ligase 2 n=1 Tax=Nocardioides mangrovi TaxID=2874580 RepID=A0ABS7U7J5_9ACTN|nr:glutamate--cysteine ligase [Nocardioides mangrovi]MBZ5736945.1 glutamate--cysteine ligase [Nocardioides mangrovi]
MARTVGVEEELLLLDPDSRQVAAAAPAVLKEFHEHGHGRRPPHAATDEIDHELFRHQLETRTDPASDLGAVLDQVLAARRTAGEAARAVGLRVGAAGTVPLGGSEPVLTTDDRYRDMLDTYGQVAGAMGTCGMHVHTEVGSDEEGVAVIDAIAPWLPVLVALSANSPFADGVDTGYASWRAQVWSRWPSAGPTAQFGSVAGYRAVARTLLETGAARDPGMLYFDARLSESQPTVEVRVCDVCTDPAIVVGIVALVRGLVETTAGEWRSGGRPAQVRVETLRAAHWRASRHGMSDALVHPETERLAPAREVLAALVDRVRAAVDAAGDAEVVDAVLERPVAGNGAARQRSAYERTGEVAGVVDDLIARTEGSWAPGALGSAHG